MDGFGLVSRTAAARWLAPAVFLLAVTGVVLLVRSALRTDESATKARTAPTAVRTATAPRVATAIASVPKQYYVIQSGDTLDAIAAHFATTTSALLELNPAVEPTALHPGERVRVK